MTGTRDAPPARDGLRPAAPARAASGRLMVTVVHERTWPGSPAAERAGAPYVVLLGEGASELSRHATAGEALEAARAEGPGAAVWRAGDVGALDAEPLAEVREG